MLTMIISPPVPSRRHAADPGDLPPATGASSDRAAAAAAALFATPILVVEDESMIAWMIENVLLDAGFTSVDMAATGEDAERIAATAPPGLIISDVNLGAGKDGIAVATAIRATSTLPVIFVTAYADPAMRDRVAAALPGAQLLRKPVDEAVLLRAVMRALGS